MSDRSLTSVISQSLNYTSGREDGRKVAFRLDDVESPSEVKHWISTGSTVLDVMISNDSENRGLPTGKIGVLYGSSGCMAPDTPMVVRLDGESQTNLVNYADIEDLIEDHTVEVPTTGGEWTEVVDFLDRGEKPGYRVTTTISSFVCSYDHLVQTTTGEPEPDSWTLASDLKVGDTVTTETGEMVEVVEKEHTQPQRFFDITVANPNSAYVACGVVHHNSGKSLIASHVMADCQQQGGVAVYIDTEAAADFSFMKVIGIDPEGDFLYVAENRLEKIFDMVETVIEKQNQREDDDRPVVVVIDSIAGSVTENEIEGSYSKEGFNTDKAIVLSRAMRKITGLVGRQNVLLLFTNQIRTDPSVMYGDPHTTPGGKAVEFHSSIRIKMRKAKRIKENGEIVGAEIRPQITKNRLAPPDRHTSFDLYFNSGIDDYGNWFDEMKSRDVIKKSGSGWYEIKKEDGSSFTKSELKEGSDKDEPYKIQQGDFIRRLHEDVNFRSRMYDRLSSNIVHEYESGWVDRSDKEYVAMDEDFTADED